MSTQGAAAARTAATPRRSFIDFVTQPAVDRVVAIIACVPFVWLTYYRYTHTGLGIPLLAFAAGILVLLGAMMVRRAPKRLTPNPWFWALAFFASYWPMLTLTFVQPGRALAPPRLLDAVAVIGALMLIWARLSLGRNIGLVPAQREIVTTGAYRYIRHPIYFGVFITSLAVGLRAFTLRNAALLTTQVALFMIKSVVEERFLSADPQYAAYMQTVKKRWIPFVV
jgi:protein-S-isoprenylcysteine O-methyltransferase Ste14